MEEAIIIAQRKRIIQINLADIIENPRSDKTTKRNLSEQNITEEDFQKFCEAMSEYGHYLPCEKERIYDRSIQLYMLKLMRITGMRSQEARALMMENITFEDDAAYVSIRRSIGSTRDEYDTLVNTKTRQSVRDIPVVGEGVSLLKEILDYSMHDLIFAHYNGKPISTDEFCDYLYRVSKSCGIKVYTVLMRKSFSADLYRRGANPAVIKMLMGHKNEDMFLNSYATAGKEDLLETTKNRKFKK